MPARNLPLLTNAHNTNGRIVPNCDNRGNKESNAVHFYENDLVTGSGYAYRRRRESSRSTGGSQAVLDKVSQHAVHFPAVQTSSASSNRGHADSVGGSGTSDGRLQALSPDAAVERLSHQLSSYEQREIYSYSHIYFVGPSAVKRSGVAGAPNNDGYDDDHGAYIQVWHTCTVSLYHLSGLLHGQEWSTKFLQLTNA